MQNIFVTGLVVLLMITGVCIGSAEKVTDEIGAPQNSWNGSWMSEIYTLLILQNGSSIAGSYEPMDIMTRDPGLLKGTLSEDGNTFFGIWSESGSVSLTLSEDNLSFSGTGAVNQEGKADEPFAYTKTGSRIDAIQSLGNPWSGTWETERNTYTLIQNGTVLTGSYVPLSPDNDEPGLIEGVVSDDNRELTGTWIESGNFSFTQSDNGENFVGTYGSDLSDSAVIDFWNGTKIL